MRIVEAGGGEVGHANIKLALAARTGNANSVFSADPRHEIRTYLRATAVNTSLDVIVAEQYDGTNWITLATFTQLTGAGRQAIAIPAGRTGNAMRVAWTNGGSGSTFEFKVAEAE